MAEQNNDRTTASKVPDRIGKQAFLEELALQLEVEPEEAVRFYDAFVGAVTGHASEGRTIMLTGFGRFYPQLHKGHLVQFGGEGGHIPDYTVLKFSAAKNVNRSLENTSAAAA